MQILIGVPLMRTLLRAQVWGQRPRGAPKGLILAPNHQSWIDPVLVQFAVVPAHVTFLMTENFFDIPVATLYFRAAGARPVRTEGPSVGAMRTALQVLNEGKTICMFPEGGITRDGRLREGQRGVARMARRTGATVVPMGIRGTMHVIGPAQPMPRLHPVEIHIGEPMLYDESDDREGEQRFTDRLMAEIQHLAYSD